MKGKGISTTWILVIIFSVGTVFRLFNFEKGFYFAHDQDLYSWIAKDILVNHHQRLVGQITSVDGVFIGSFYYYLMAMTYWLGRMNPLVAMWPLWALGLATIGSVWWTVKRNYGERVGEIAATIYAISLGIALFDRWSVPTQPTLLWSIWFMATILELRRGNLKFLPIYGFLCGFVWQLHIALLPVLPIPILAYFVGGNKIDRLGDKENWRYTLIGVVVFVMVFSPFVAFELKHNFSQIKSLIAATSAVGVGPTGWLKLKKVFEASGIEFQQRFLYGWRGVSYYWWWLAWGIATLVSVIKKRLDGRDAGLLAIWVGLIMLAQFTSKRVVSEYYFTNLVPLFLLSLAIVGGTLDRRLVTILGLSYLVINGYWLLTRTDYDQSYFYRRQLVDFVRTDAIKNNYPCIAVNYIADPGVGVGFRYLFWYKGVKLVKPGTENVPVYNVPIPWQLSLSENPVVFGRFGVITPTKMARFDSAVCDKKENQLDPLLGYTE